MMRARCESIVRADTKSLSLTSWLVWPRAAGGERHVRAPRSAPEPVRCSRDGELSPEIRVYVPLAGRDPPDRLNQLRVRAMFRDVAPAASAARTAVGWVSDETTMTLAVSLAFSRSELAPTGKSLEASEIRAYMSGKAGVTYQRPTCRHTPAG